MFKIKEIKTVIARDPRTSAKLFEIDFPIKEVKMQCPECHTEMELHDTTYSNINTPRAKDGQHTGNIYWCENCERTFIEDFLTNTVHSWQY